MRHLNLRISRDLSNQKIPSQPPWRLLIMRGILSLSTIAITLPIIVMNAEARVFKEYPPLVEEKADLGSGRYLVKLNNDTGSGGPVVTGTARLSEILINYPDAQVTPLLDEGMEGVVEGMAGTQGEARELISNVYVLEVNPTTNSNELINQLYSNPEVKYVEKDGMGWANATYPNDPSFNQEWGLHNTGQTGGTPDADIDAPEAWSILDFFKMHIGTQVITLAIVDTGIDYRHKDLKGKVTAGYDFANNDSDPMDDHGHGTHVAGTAAAKTNNKIGIAGVCVNCQVMPVKVLTGGGWGYWSWVAKGIIYAVDNGAQVINLSLGGYSDSKTLHNAVKYAYRNNVPVIAAAGNSPTPIVFPARHPETITVTATDHRDKKASWAASGDELDLSAPGVSILSTLPNNRYAKWNGTSMATPHVTGAVGVLLSIMLPFYPDFSPEDVRNCLHSSSDELGSWWSYGAGRLNLKELLSVIDMGCQ